MLFGKLFRDEFCGALASFPVSASMKIDEMEFVMGKESSGFVAHLQKSFNAVCAFFRKIYSPAYQVGNKDRVQKEGELDADDEKLRELNRSWREMLREDPWMIKLMPHVRRLCTAMGIFFLMHVIGGAYFPPKHPLFDWVTICTLATIPYWFWVGGWYKRIQDKVWSLFIKRFGKHVHRK